ncbi:MAG: HDOD domain-containing protein, partial [Planctomycetota bacterium]
MTPPHNPLFLARQPIFNRRMEVEAYELLFRAGKEGAARFDDADRATSDVLVNACIELGLERVVGDRPAYINLTPSFLAGRVSLPVGPEQIVLEVLEDTIVNSEILAGVERLKREGYRIALDDFDPTGPTKPLLPMADIVKVDCREHGVEHLQRLAKSLARPGLLLLAEKVETHDELELCRDAGFELFQGYFLSRPTVLEGRKLSSSRAQLLRILGALHAEDASIDLIQDTVSADVSLSYRLLRYINSATFGLSRELNSVREAVMYLGLTRVRNLVTLFLLASVDSKPEELIRTAMLRGRMCEVVAREAGRDAPDSYFTVGMFSCLDALLDVAMRELIDQLPLADAVCSALTERDGEFGEVLSSVLCYEVGEFESAINDPAVGDHLGFGRQGLDPGAGVEVGLAEVVADRRVLDRR